jgi:hypothetical protein
MNPLGVMGLIIFGGLLRKGTQVSRENDWLLYCVAYVYNHVPIMKWAVGWT